MRRTRGAVVALSGAVLARHLRRVRGRAPRRVRVARGPGGRLAFGRRRAGRRNERRSLRGRWPGPRRFRQRDRASARCPRVSVLVPGLHHVQRRSVRLPEAARGVRRGLLRSIDRSVQLRSMRKAMHELAALRRWRLRVRLRERSLSYRQSHELCSAGHGEQLLSEPGGALLLVLGVRRDLHQRLVSE